MSDYKARDLSALEKTVNDSAGKLMVLWTSFITLGAYLLIATGSVKHRDLFLDAPIKLPILSVDLPVTGYFLFAPLILLIFHFYVLLQLSGLSQKISDYNLVLNESLESPHDRRLARRRLDDFPFLQFLAGVRERRLGVPGAMQIGIFWITIVLFPVTVFLQLQIAFLPYHSEPLTWLHRLCLVADLVLIWVFWRSFRRLRGSRRYRNAWRVLAIGGTVVVLVFGVFLTTFPGESFYRNWVSKLADAAVSLVTGDRTVSRFLFEGDVDGVSGRPSSLFANRIIVPGERFYDPEKQGKLDVSVAVRGRDLRGAILQRADLRKADFTGANLLEASLVGASLQGSRFGCAAKLDVAPEAGLRKRTRAEECDSDRATDLRFANFSDAAMQGATLDYAKLQGARLVAANAQGASLKEADLTAALMGDMHLEAASLVKARLFGAYVMHVHLQGADLGETDFEGANLSQSSLAGANILGAEFSTTQMNGTDFYRAYGTNRSGVEKLCKSAMCDHVVATPEIPETFRFGPQAPEDYSGKQEPKRLDAEGYKLFVAKALEGVESDRIRTLIKSRLAGLDPATAVNADKQVVINKQISSGDNVVAELRVARAEAACEAMCMGEDAPVILRAMIHNNRLFNLGGRVPQLAAFLRGNDCPAARTLGAEYRAKLKGADPPSGSTPLKCKKQALVSK
jgi:uncharacterized protein YjbI with pentapeptide repeats